MSKKFKLKAKMTPKGDQPQAIEAICKGLKKGKRFQTVLGATGTGKSVTADTEVLVYLKDECGQFFPKHLKIGEIVDGLMAKGEMERQGDTEILYGCDVGERYFVPSFNADSKVVALKPITAFVRHDSPEVLYEVETKCGRKAKFTGDHNLYILRKGEVVLIETADLQDGDYLPLPCEVEVLAEQRELDFIELENYVNAGLFVNLQKELVACEEVYGEKSVGAVIGMGKRWRVTKEDERVNVRDLGRLKNEFSLMDCFDYRAKARLGDLEMSLQYPLSDEFLEFLGFYLAEGWAGDRYVLLSVREKELVDRVSSLLKVLGLPYGVRESGDIVSNSVVLVDLMKSLCGSGSFVKKLPDFWSRLSLRQLAVILRAYYAGDGGVDGAAVTCTTASEALASGLMYALSRFGVWARRAKKFKCATNSEHAGNYYHQITISGQKDLAIFAEKIGFAGERKNISLQKILGKKYNTNVDVIPGVGGLIAEVRKREGLTQREVGELAGLSRSAIGLIENGVREISREACERLVGSGHFEELRSFLNLRWTQVASCEAFESEEEYVYDFSVKDNETFLAGEGGMFVHNTFTMAKIVEEMQRPTLVLAHNKTLAAQLCSEFQEFFPENAVSYFVSYYDYYQPEAYQPATDTYIEKDSAINEEIDKFRHAATANLLTRKDVLIVASVSCIYGLGSVEDYEQLAQTVKVGDMIVRDQFLRRLTELQYRRSDMEFRNSMFHVLGDVVEVYPPDRDTVFRLEFFGDEVEAINEVEPFTGELLRELETVTIFPAKHNVSTEEKVKNAVEGIREDMELRCAELKKQGRNLEAERLRTRTEYDIEILQETGYVSGIENYVRYLDGAPEGGRPRTLMDYLPKDFLLFIDESHMTVPQIGGMHNGNFSRKQTLIEHGFRLPSAHDNRPLRFDEFEDYMNNAVFVSATPGKYEKEKTPKEDVVELVVRPTGLVDPDISVRPTKGQIEDLLKEIRKRTDKGDRVLITTLTKRSAEDLTEFLSDADIRVRYLHSDIDTIERIEILRDLRLGKFDVLVGINLLREGLDLPEVSLVAILDADKQGFLRSASALIQTIGRCARNVDGFVIMYADKETDAMLQAIDETMRRREKQQAYNKEHGITPQTIKKAIRDISHFGGKKKDGEPVDRGIDIKKVPKDEAKRLIENLEQKMDIASQNLEFEKAAELRDEIDALREELGI